jgi:hypothetical protein
MLAQLAKCLRERKEGKKRRCKAIFFFSLEEQASSWTVRDIVDSKSTSHDTSQLYNEQHGALHHQLS